MAFKPEEVKGVVRTEQQKGDQHRDKPYTALLNNGERVRLDAGEAKSLENRLAKDRSRMEKEGTRQKEREPDRRAPNHVASEADKRAFLDRFKRSQ